MTREMIDSALKELTESAGKIYGDKLKEVILFGSCARGDFSKDSDIDVMILVDVPLDKVNDEMDKLQPAISELDRKYEYELLFAPIVQSYSEFNYWLEVMPFYKNIKSEGRLCMQHSGR